MLERLVKICRASQVKKVQPGGVLREAMTIEKRYTFRLKESGVADYCRCGGPAVPAFWPFLSALWVVRARAARYPIRKIYKGGWYCSRTISF